MPLRVKGGQDRDPADLIHTGNVVFALAVVGGLGLVVLILRSWL